mgnify:CR=1 FL=1
MLNKIITYSIKNKLIVGLFVVSLIGWGAYQVTQLPIDAVPDITDNQVQVLPYRPHLAQLILKGWSLFLLSKLVVVFLARSK